MNSWYYIGYTNIVDAFGSLPPTQFHVDLFYSILRLIAR